MCSRLLILPVQNQLRGCIDVLQDEKAPVDGDAEDLGLPGAICLGDVDVLVLEEVLELALGVYRLQADADDVAPGHVGDGLDQAGLTCSKTQCHPCPSMLHIKQRETVTCARAPVQQQAQHVGLPLLVVPVLHEACQQ